MNTKHASIVCLAWMLGIGQCVAQAATPMETVRESTKEVLQVLSDPAFEGEEKARERHDKIRAIIDEDFDWTAMCRRALGRHWRGKSEKQQEEFIELFGKLLERRYMDKIDNYSGQEVRYEDERIEEDYARVDVAIITDNDKEIDVQYRMHKKEKGWMVYDVVIEGVSLVMNYRSQFNSILGRSSFDKLLEKLREKTE